MSATLPNNDCLDVQWFNNVLKDRTLEWKPLLPKQRL